MKKHEKHIFLGLIVIILILGAHYLELYSLIQTGAYVFQPNRLMKPRVIEHAFSAQELQDIEMQMRNLGWGIEALSLLILGAGITRFLFRRT